jgi:hypothetical protein
MLTDLQFEEWVAREYPDGNIDWKQELWRLKQNVKQMEYLKENSIITKFIYNTVIPTVEKLLEQYGEE